MSMEDTGTPTRSGGSAVPLLNIRATAQATQSILARDTSVSPSFFAAEDSPGTTPKNDAMSAAPAPKSASKWKTKLAGLAAAENNSPRSPTIGAGGPPAKPGLEGRTSSFIAARRTARGMLPPGPDEKPPPTNEEIAQAVQEKVAQAVETQRKYKHVLFYSLFVAAYLIVLYLQASAYNSGEVVSTLRNALMPPGGMSTTFQSSDDVLAYIGQQVLAPAWVDPVCGDGNCEYPWEFPAWGRFGCRADCGVEANTTHILVQVNSNFVGNPNVSPNVLMAAATWNLCLSDPAREARGEQDLCWFDADQGFTEITAVRLETMDVVDGTWYVSLSGDYAGRVSGAVYDLRNESNPIQLATTPEWEMCAQPQSDTRTVTTSASNAVRRLLTDWTARQERRRKLLEAGEPVGEADNPAMELKNIIDNTLTELEHLLDKAKKEGRLVP